LRVYDPAGRVTANLADGRLGAGEYRFSFTPHVPGVYVAKLTLAGRDTYSAKLVAVR
jgi:hypothetical protein